MPANEIEAIVTKALRDRLTSSGHGASTISDPDAILTWVAKMRFAPNNWRLRSKPESGSCIKRAVLTKTRTAAP